MISKHFDFEQSRLARAVSATFLRRGTLVPEDVPEGLSQSFAHDKRKSEMWEALKPDFTVNPGSLAEVVDDLKEFLMLAAQSARNAMN